jgi:hypothetical protein
MKPALPRSKRRSQSGGVRARARDYSCVFDPIRAGDVRACDRELVTSACSQSGRRRPTDVAERLPGVKSPAVNLAIAVKQLCRLNPKLHHRAGGELDLRYWPCAGAHKCTDDPWRAKEVVKHLRAVEAARFKQ